VADQSADYAAIRSTVRSAFHAADGYTYIATICVAIKATNRTAQCSTDWSAQLAADQSADYAAIWSTILPTFNAADGDA
jgi:hypothetical protein